MFATLRIITLLSLGASLLMSSCKDHCEYGQDKEPIFTKRMVLKANYETEWQYPVTGGHDWENDSTWDATFQLPYHLLKPRRPEGLRVQLYTGIRKASIFNLSPSGGIVPFTEGYQSLLFYNNNTEYIVFDELQSFKLATATTTTRSGTDNQFGAAEDILENVKNSPDMLYSYYIETFKGKEHNDTETVTVTLRPLVFSYLIQCEFSKGYELVSQARGNLTGMSEAVSLTTLETSAQTASLSFQGTVRPFAIQALVRSFGSPGYPNTKAPSAHQNKLTLDVRLKDGTVQHFQFDVTSQIDSQPRGGVIRITGIKIDESKGNASHNSGFDVDVSDWGEEENILFPLK